MRLNRMILVACAVLIVASGSTFANVKFSQSPVKIAYFTWCTSGVCVPMPYRWQASLSVEYDIYYDQSIGTNWVFIKKVDQTVSMYGTGSNPCDIRMSATTKGYDKWGNFYWTIRATNPGSYLYGSNTSFWGGATYPNWWIPGPKLKMTAVAGSNKCVGAPSISWDTYL